MLVDCDIHVGYETLLDLAPYLDPATRELVVNCGTNGLGMPSYPWYHPTGWLRNDAFDRGSAAVGAQLVGQTLDRVRDERPRSARARPRDPHAGRGRGVLDPPERPPRRPPGACVQRLAARALARARAAAARPDRRPRPASRGRRGRDPPRRRARRVRRRVPPRRGADPVRQPRARPDLARVRRPRPAGRRPHALRGRRHRGPGHAAGYPDHYGEYHALCGSGMHGHFASILCHGILERFPRTG